MTKSIDAVGKKYNMLTVLERASSDKYGNSQFVCKCDCGKIVTVLSTKLRNEVIKSCGCNRHKIRIVDLSGKKYSRLLVIELFGTKHGAGAIWKCKCDCGNECLIRSRSLINGNTRSCGCIKSETFRCLKRNMSIAMGEGEVAFREVKREYIGGAKKRNLSWNLSDDDMKSIIYSNCYYCNKNPSSVKLSNSGNCIHNGIDRIDSSIGYEKSNVVPCCTNCNLAKRAMGLDEFGKWVSSVYHNFGIKYDDASYATA